MGLACPLPRRIGGRHERRDGYSYRSRTVSADGSDDQEGWGGFEVLGGAGHTAGEARNQLNVPVAMNLLLALRRLRVQGW
eukprot:3758107-Prymnesium_polylepis.1